MAKEPEIDETKGEETTEELISGLYESMNQAAEEIYGRDIIIERESDEDDQC